MSIHSYSPEEVDFLIAGLVPVRGFVDGTFIDIRKNVTPYGLHTSTDGLNSRVYRNSNTYTAQITLSSTSESNEILTKIWQLDEITQMGKFPIIIKDNFGSSLFFSATAWIQQPADMYYSNRITDRVWIFQCTQCTFTVGGNEEPSGAIEDLVNGIISSIPSLGRLL